MDITNLARRTPQSHAKRQREQAKKEKRRAKEEKKALRKAQKAGIDLETNDTPPEGQTHEEEHGAKDEHPYQRPDAPG